MTAISIHTVIVIETAQPTRRRSRAFVPAVLCDGVAVIGLVAVAVGATVRGEALGLVFLGALVGVAVIPGAVLSGVALRSALKRRGWRTGPIVLLIAVLSVAAVLAGPAALLVGWNATPNPADDVAAPFEASLQALGGTRLCDNGDAGRGPDDFSPWREVYAVVPASTAILPRLEQQASAEGFGTLERSTERASSFPDSQRFTARRGGGSRPAADLSVELSATGTQLLCEPDYGRTFHPAAHSVVVDVSVTLDPTE